MTSRESIERLVALNEMLAELEDAGSRDELAQLLTPVFVMRRASGALVDRDQFLADVKPRAPEAPPRTPTIRSIEVLGARRAVVRVDVAIGARRFDNLRVFVLDGVDWKIAGWFNEEID